MWEECSPRNAEGRGLACVGWVVGATLHDTVLIQGWTLDRSLVHTVWYGVVKCSALLCNVVQLCVVLYNMGHCGALWCSVL